MNRSTNLTTVSCLLATTLPLAAQTCRLAADINKTPLPASASPQVMAHRSDRLTDQRFTRSGNALFFAATTLSSGSELWKTDGTPAGTALVKNFHPGTGNGFTKASEITSLRVAGQDILVMQAKDGIHGEELWWSDGTTAGTYQVADLYPGTTGSFPSNFTLLGSRVYFSANHPTAGRELWSTDGTAAGTALVADISPGPSGSYPAFLRLSSNGSEIYFHATTTATGGELFKTGGTASTTGLVKDIAPGRANSIPRGLWNVAGVTVFLANTFAHGDELWRTDGTAAGTTLLLDIDPGPNGPEINSSNVVTAGNRLFFPATEPNAGTELWETDGTPAGTRLAADIYPGPPESSPRDLHWSGTELYFSASGPASGRELWVLRNGTATMLKDIEPGSGGSNPQSFVSFGATTVFSAYTSVNGWELWKTDGTNAGTQLLRDIQPGPESAFPNWFSTLGSGQAIFSAKDASHGTELWVTDGTRVGSKLLKDIDPVVGTEGANLSVLAARNGNSLLASANDGSSGQEPWFWRPGQAPQLLIDANPGSGNSNPSRATACGNKFFFTATNPGVTGREAYVTDGTPAGTFLLKDIRPGSALGVTGGFVSLGDLVLFPADDGTHGTELWISDGSTAGTKLLVDLHPGASSQSQLRYLTFYKGKIYFSASDQLSTGELWSTDGTAAGTQVVSAIRSNGDAEVAEILVHAGRLYFAANDGVHGRELWSSDGTRTGTQMVRDLVTGSTGSSPRFLVSVGSKLAFVATERATGQELYTSDGTPAGTKLVKDIRPGPRTSIFLGLVPCGDRVFTAAYDDTHGRELWVSDLTPAGTRMVRDIYPGSQGSEPQILSCVDGQAYISARDAEGTALYKTDGTASGTVEICEQAPSSIVRMGGALYFGGSSRQPYTTSGLIAINQPGAMIEVLGQPCGPTQATMQSSPPKIGTTLRLSGTDATSRIRITLLALPPQDSMLLPFLAPGCRSFISRIEHSFAPVTAPQWSISVSIPNLPSMIGGTIVTQTWSAAQTSLFPLTTTNALQLTIGR